MEREKGEGQKSEEEREKRSRRGTGERFRKKPSLARGAERNESKSPSLSPSLRANLNQLSPLALEETEQRQSRANAAARWCDDGRGAIACVWGARGTGRRLMG